MRDLTTTEDDESMAQGQLSSVSSLRDGSFSMGDFKMTESVNLRSDSKGNAFLNQYVVIKDLGQGAFGKVRVR